MKKSISRKRPSTSGTQQAAEPRGCTHFKLRQLLRAVGRLYDSELAAAGLKGTQFSLLSSIIGLEPVQPADLARHMGLDASTLTRNLRVMIDEGWVLQGPGHDSRSRLIVSTPAGRARYTLAKRHWKRAQLELNAQLGAPQVAALHELIEHGLAQLHAVDAQPVSQS